MGTFKELPIHLHSEWRKWWGMVWTFDHNLISINVHWSSSAESVDADLNLGFMTFRTHYYKTGSNIFRRLYRPLLSAGLLARIIASLMPISKYLGFLSKTFTGSKSTLCHGLKLKVLCCDQKFNTFFLLCCNRFFVVQISWGLSIHKIKYRIYSNKCPGASTFISQISRLISQISRLKHPFSNNTFWAYN